MHPKQCKTQINTNQQLKNRSIMPFDVEEIKKRSKINYEKTWLETKKLLTLEGNYFNLEKKGKSHIINDLISDIRQKIISLGFEELILPMLVEENEIYKQYGPEAAIILDRLFYLAGLPRPDIGISIEKVKMIQEVFPDFNNIEGLKKIFRSYKKGEIESDDLIESFIDELGINETYASEILDKFFPELKQLKPIPSKMTLRSHTTALWFKVLPVLARKNKMPLQYFTIGQKFRREQKIDATHLYASVTLSLIIMAEEISLEDCQNIASSICKQLGFERNRIEIKKATSKYYAPQTEYEIFVEHPTTNEWIEIGDGGFYSPVSLAQYNIQYPVFNIGFGIERICMIKTQIDDIRKLVYPYYYEDQTFSDKEISNSIKYKLTPLTENGKAIKNAIVKSALKYKDEISPIKIKVWEGRIKDKNIAVYLWERDKNVKLLGPAALNELWVKDGNVIGVPPEEIPESAVYSNKSYLEGIASEMSYYIEVMLDQDKKEYEHRVKVCYRASEVNIELDDIVLEYIHLSKKRLILEDLCFSAYHSK